MIKFYLTVLLFVVAFISVWLLVLKCFCFLMHFVYLVCCAGFPFVGAVLVLFVAIVWFALRGRVDLNMSIFSCLLLLFFFPSMWLLFFSLFFVDLFLLTFVCCFCCLFPSCLLLFCYCFAFVWFVPTHILTYTHTHKHAYTQTRIHTNT